MGAQEVHVLSEQQLVIAKVMADYLTTRDWTVYLTMSQHCINCNSFAINAKFCKECGSKLIDRSESKSVKSSLTELYNAYLKAKEIDENST